MIQYCKGTHGRIIDHQISNIPTDDQKNESQYIWDFHSDVNIGHYNNALTKKSDYFFGCGSSYDAYIYHDLGHASGSGGD